MEDETKYLLDKLDSYANSLTGFIVIQGLIFCYALANPNLLSAFKNMVLIRYWVTGAMALVICAVVFILFRLKHQAAVAIIGKASMNSLLWAFWIRMAAVVFYGTLPLVLLLMIC